MSDKAQKVQKASNSSALQFKLDFKRKELDKAFGNSKGEELSDRSWYDTVAHVLKDENIRDLLEDLYEKLAEKIQNLSMNS